MPLLMSQTKRSVKTQAIGAWVRVLVTAAVMSFAPMSIALADESDSARRAAIAEAVDQAGGRGKVLSVKPGTNSNGRTVYKIRILTDGRVRTFSIPSSE